jgi:AcrR family transcriptional regulator
MNAERSLNTKMTILDTALALVRKIGFKSVSINDLAKEVGMSKSGLFAHFNSKESMHMMILDHAAQSFTQGVFVPAIKQPRGLPRLRAIINNWMNWYGNNNEGGCPFLVAAAEYDGKPGDVKDRLNLHLTQLIKSLTKAVSLCMDQGHLDSKESAEQVAYEIYSLILGALIFNRTLGKKSSMKMFQNSLEQLLTRYSPTK